MNARIMCAMVFLAAAVFSSGNNVIAGGREKLPNEVNLELAGKCLLYSFSYQRMLAEPFGIEAGISMIGGGSSGSSTSIVFFTFGGKLYFIQGNASPYFGGGLVVTNTSVSSGPFSDSESGSYGYLTPGFEFRSEGGFLIRGGVYALINSGGFFIWPGLTVGVAF